MLLDLNCVYHGCLSIYQFESRYNITVVSTAIFFKIDGR